MWGTHFSWWVGTIGRADEKLEDMSDRPKIEVIDRRKIKAEEEKESGAAAQAAPAEKPAAPAQSGPGPGPRLVVNEATREASGHEAEERESAQAAEKRLAEELPLGPTAEEGRKSKAAYDASAQRIEDLIRAQNPAVGAQPPVGFEHLVQQFYLGARATIDLLGVLAEKSKGNLSAAEDRMLQSVLFELRMAFLELSSMVTAPNVPPAPKGRD
jgi:hypothetical protein